MFVTYLVKGDKQWGIKNEIMSLGCSIHKLRASFRFERSRKFVFQKNWVLNGTKFILGPKLEDQTVKSLSSLAASVRTCIGFTFMWSGYHRKYHTCNPVNLCFCSCLHSCVHQKAPNDRGSWLSCHSSRGGHLIFGVEGTAVPLGVLASTRYRLWPAVTPGTNIPSTWPVYLEKQILKYCNIEDASEKKVSMCFNEDRDVDDDGMVVKCNSSVFHLNRGRWVERQICAPELFRPELYR